MNARFEIGKRTDGQGNQHNAEFVVLSGGLLGGDEVRREATDADKALYPVEYNALKNPPPPPEDKDATILEKDATIAALQAELAKANEPKK